MLTVMVVSTLSNCDNGSNPGPQLPAPPIVEDAVDLEDAKLTSFRLMEVDAPHVEVEIIHPMIVNGVETRFGEIKVIVTKEFDFVSYSLKEVPFDQGKFSISPAVGERAALSTTAPTLYTVKSKSNPNKTLHYNVLKVVKPLATELKVTSFRFEKRKNPDLAADIEAEKIEAEGQFRRIFIFVPVGTDFTNLTPSISFEGAKLLYTTSSAVDQDYPTNGASIDFKYPKTFRLKVSSGISGLVDQLYDVIVDVKNPLKFDANPIVVPDIISGSAFSGTIGSFTNQGNHLLTSFSPTYASINLPIGINRLGLVSLTIPGGGLEPGKSSDVSYALLATHSSSFPTGTYQFTTTVQPGFVSILTLTTPTETSTLLTPSSVDITVNLK